MARKFKEIYGEVVASTDELLNKVFAQLIETSGLESLYTEDADPMMRAAVSCYGVMKKLTIDQAEKLDEMADEISEIKKIVEKKSKEKES
jgi:hypothetical protein